MANFVKGQVPWNKGTKGVMKAWNKGTGDTNTCIVCMTIYPTRDRKPTTKYCSNKCKYSDKTWSKQQAEKIRGRPGPWAGKKRPEMAGSNAWNWKGGVTPESRKQRVRFRQTLQSKIFTRDNFTCQICGVYGSSLQVDHIKGWAKYPELRFEESNCRTLCMACHYYVTFKRKLPQGVIWGHNLSRRVG